MDTEAAPPPRPPATGTGTGDQPCAPPVPAPVTTAQGNTATPTPSTAVGTGANDDDAPAPEPGHDNMADDDGTGDASTENAAEATMMQQHFECVPCTCVPVPTPGTVIATRSRAHTARPCFQYLCVFYLSQELPPRVGAGRALHRERGV